MLVNLRYLVCLIGISSACNAAAASYEISSDDSAIRFAGELSGERFDGQFHEFNGRIEFDPEALDDTQFYVEIQMSSVDTQSEERDEALATSEWFDPQQFPSALFQATGAKQVDAGYLSQASLKIRSIVRPVAFSFSVDESGKMLRGKATLNRIDWDLGGEDWSDEELVSHTVLVEVEVKLNPSD